MYFLNWTSDADPGMPTRAEIAEGTHWNLWRLRQVPFNELWKYPGLTDGVGVAIMLP